MFLGIGQNFSGLDLDSSYMENIYTLYVRLSCKKKEKEGTYIGDREILLYLVIKGITTNDKMIQASKISCWAT